MRRFLTSTLQRRKSSGSTSDDRKVDINNARTKFRCPICRKLSNTLIPLLPGQKGIHVREEHCAGWEAPNLSTSSPLSSVGFKLGNPISSMHPLNQSEIPSISRPFSAEVEKNLGKGLLQLEVCPMGEGVKVLFKYFWLLCSLYWNVCICAICCRLG